MTRPVCMIRSLSFEFANVIYNIFQKPSEETSELKKGVRKIRWMMSIPSKIKTLGHVLDFLSTRGGGAIVWTDIMWAGRQHNWQARKEFPARSCHYHHSLQYVHAGDRMNPSIFIAQKFTRSFFSNFKLLTRLPQEAEWMNESFRMAHNLKKQQQTELILRVQVSVNGSTRPRDMKESHNRTSLLTRNSQWSITPLYW